MALVTSHGFAGSYSSTGFSLGASVVAGEGARMQRDYEYRTAHHAGDLLAPAEIGRIAGERAVARLDPGRMASQPMTVVFEALRMRRALLFTFTDMAPPPSLPPAASVSVPPLMSAPPEKPFPGFDRMRLPGPDLTTCVGALLEPSLMIAEIVKSFVLFWMMLKEVFATEARLGRRNEVFAVPPMVPPPEFAVTKMPRPVRVRLVALLAMEMV